MPATETSVDRTVNPKVLLSLIKWANNKTSAAAEINGELGEKIKSAAENSHLHKRAFSFVRRLCRMDELKAAEEIRNTLLYIEIAEAGGYLKKHAGDLVGHGEGEDQGDETQGDGGDGDGGEDDKGPGDGAVVKLSDAARAVEAGIKQLKPGKGGKLDGGDAPGTTRVN